VQPAEVILVDDASDDGTLAVLQAIEGSSQSDWVRLIARQRRGGPGAARNVAWDAAVQPYLAFLDADDTWHPRKLEIQYRWMERHPDVALTGHPCEWPPAGAMSAIVPDEPEISVTKARKILMSNRFQTPSVMVKRHLPFRFPADMRYAEDYLLWCRLVLSGCSARRLEIVLASLHKSPFGGGGLSGHLWAMEAGELEVYRRLRAEALIPAAVYPVLVAWSLVRYMRRLILSGLTNGR
jgi:glycosyltransferase involved in cell wall biosynthesis